MIAVPVTKIAALFALLSPLAILTAIPISIQLGRRPAPIDFGNAEELARLHATSPKVIRFVSLTVAGPVLALGAGIGWYELTKDVGSYAVYGVSLWYLGMVFVIVNDVLELATVARLPAAFCSTRTEDRGALLAFGATMALAIELFALIGDLVSFLGLGLISLAMLHSPMVARWIALLGVVSAALILAATVAGAFTRKVDLIPRARLVGFNLFMLWIIATSVVLWRA